MKLKLLLLTISFISITAFAQNTNRIFLGFTNAGAKVDLSVSDGAYAFESFSKQIVHTTFIPLGQTPKNFTYATVSSTDAPKFTVSETEALLKISNGEMTIVVQKSPFAIRYDYKNNLLLSENKGYFATDSSQILNFNIQSDEFLYGGGTRVLGMNHRGYKLELYNKAHYGYTTRAPLMNYTLPLVLSSHKYALLFDNASKGWLDLDSKKDNNMNYETVSGTLNYFVIAGENWENLIEQYTALTGHQPLPPRWVFGNFSSRFGYHSQKEVLSTVDRFFKDSIPVEAVIVDIYWFGKGIFNDMGRLDWYADSFPEPKKMIQTLKDKGVNTILVTEPFILSTSDRWQEAVDAKILGTDTLGNPYRFDFYFGNSGLVDVFKPEARDWFWNIYKGLTNQGVAGWWGDLGEPERHPSSLQHVNGTADEVHNAYGHRWAQMVYEGYQKDFPTVRPFILMRSGYAGSQRYGMIPWTGDVSRSWGGLVSQPELALTMGMQGLAYTHSDLGGFGGGDSLNNELYTRWLQYGVFQPVYRPHAQEQFPAEPVFQKESTKELAKAAIQLRYKLLPYNYTMAFENSQNGKPFMRPLFFEETDNTGLMVYDSAYFWGDAFLVAPIKAAGVKQQAVYFPKGNNWVDYYSGKLYAGGQKVEVPVDISHIPVFVRTGSLIPMLKKVGSTSQANFNSLEVHYYFDASKSASEYKLYNDDGHTPGAFEKGAYEIASLVMNTNASGLVFDYLLQQGKSYSNSMEKSIELIVHSMAKKPAKVLLDGKKLDAALWNYSKEKSELSVALDFRLSRHKVDILY